MQVRRDYGGGVILVGRNALRYTAMVSATFGQEIQNIYVYMLHILLYVSPGSRACVPCSMFVPQGMQPPGNDMYGFLF